MAVNALEAGERRLLYGFNVVVGALVATGVLTLIIVLANQFGGQVDLTRRGVNSLSQRTVKLVQDLEQPVRITALYSVPTDVVEVYERRRDAVADLLELYDAAGGAQVSVQVIDPVRDRARTEQLVADLRNKASFADEVAPHQAALDSFAELRTALAETAFEQVRQLREVLPQLQQSAATDSFRVNVTNIRRMLERVALSATDTQERVAELTDGPTPRYGAATTAAQEYLTTARESLSTARSWMRGELVELPAELPADLRRYLDEAAARFAPLIERSGTLLAELGELEEVRLERILRDLQTTLDTPPILLETDGDALVVPFQEVWQRPIGGPPPGEASPDPERNFLGEQAISSALLRLTATRKIGVVFVRFGGAGLLTPDFTQFDPRAGRLPQAPLSLINDALVESNFEVAEWDVQQTSAPPTLEDVADLAYVVLPPAPPPQPDPMRPSPQAPITEAQKQAVYDAINAAGKVVFLAGWTPQGYEYGEYVRQTWGVAVESDYFSMRFSPSPAAPGLWVPINALNPNADGAILTAPDVVRLSDHPITEPLQTAGAGFSFVAPLRLGADAVAADTNDADEPTTEPNASEDAVPKLTHSILAEVVETDTIWAVNDLARLRRDFQRDQGTRPQPTDIRPPFPIAAAVERGDGSRAVVISSERFLSNQMLEANTVAIRGNALVSFRLYPGNADLLLNALHWLTGEVGRISVGPRTGGMPVLSELEAGEQEQFVRALVIGVWPTLALAAGGVAWMWRRR